MIKKFKVIIAGLLIVAIMGFSVACSTSKSDSETSADDKNAPAAEYEPEKTVEVLVGFAAGGGTDVAARKITEILTKEEIIKQPLIVNNLPGGMGVRALSELKSRKADTHTILFNNGFAPPLWTGKVDLSLSDFKLVAGTSAVYRFILVSKDSPYQTLEEFLAGMKNNPKLTIGVTGTLEEGDAQYWHKIKDSIGIDKINMVTTGGASEVLTLLLQGQVDVVILPPVVARDFIEVGDLRPIASLTEERVEDYPEVPTFKEVTGNTIIYNTYMGVWLSKEVPDNVADFWNKAIKKAVRTEDWKNFVIKRGMILEFLGPDEYKDYIKTTGEEYQEFLKSLQK